MTTNEDLLERRVASVPRGVVHAAAIFPVRAVNAELWDVEGRRYIDFDGGIGVLNTGHRHPQVMAAVDEQLGRFTHTAFQVMPYERYVALAERLNALASGQFAKKSIFFSTGAEAVENGVKIARAATHRPSVVAFTGSFHGRTLFTLGLTGKVVPYKTGFGPFPGDVYHVPFPMEYHGVTTSQAIHALELLFKSNVEPERIAAIVVEPVQGEGGFYVAPFEFLRHLRDICDRYGIVFVADEIQSGFARTGKMFAIEHSGVVPDLIAVAKSLTGGFPLSGVVGKSEIMDAPLPGGLGGTYGGNPVACAAVLGVIEEEKILDRSLEIGSRVRGRFENMARRGGAPCVGDVRGLGAMLAFELVKDRTTRAPDPEATKALTARALAKGLVLLSCGVYSNVIRVLVPLTATDTIIDEGVSIIEEAFTEIVAPG